MEAKERIICALDVDSAARAVELAEQLREHVGVFKIGLELLMSAGIEAVGQVLQAGARRIFLDAKLHDIPNTVAGAMRGVVRSGAWCVTLHCSGGSAMLCGAAQEARREAERLNVAAPQLLGVTLLTSLSAEQLRGELQVGRDVAGYVGDMARLAYESGCNGVIVSPREIETTRQAVPDPGFLIITPGVRPTGSAVGDQARVMAPGEAIRRGADYLVIGRPITAANDPVEAAQRFAAEIREALG